MLGHGAWFASGFPGGVDYLMLVFVKLKWMEKMTEKKYNTVIQTWIRAPGCLYHALFAWIGWRTSAEFMAQKAFLPAVAGM